MSAELRLKKLEDALTVEAELLVRHERLDEERHARIDAKLVEFDDKLLALAKAFDKKIGALTTIVESLAESQLTTKAALDRLIEHLDTFIQGRSGNGGPKRI